MNKKIIKKGKRSEPEETKERKVTKKKVKKLFIEGKSYDILIQLETSIQKGEITFNRSKIPAVTSTLLL